jgi:hypothetical protein
LEENDPTKFKENRTARMNRMRGTGAAPTPAPLRTTTDPRSAE